jgi:quinol monooxygenase YgiN
MRSKPERTGEVMAALAAIIADARATQGVISLDIARDLLDSDSFVATGIYEDAAALRRQESAPAVHRAMAMFSDASSRRSPNRPRPCCLESLACTATAGRHH